MDHKLNTIRKIISNGEYPIIEIIQDGLSQEESFNLEKDLVSQYGRRNNGTGILTNLTDGGFGGAGVVWTESRREFHSKLISGENNPMYGRFGELNPMYGKSHNEETVEKMRDYRLGTSHSLETKNKISIQTKGENNPMYGKVHSDETKKKISEKNSGKNNPHYGKKRSKETKEKIGMKHKGKKLSDLQKKALSDYAKTRTGENNPRFGKGTAVVQLDSEGNFISSWNTMSEAARSLSKVTSGGISDCCKGRLETHAGFKWLYKDDYHIGKDEDA